MKNKYIEYQFRNAQKDEKQEIYNLYKSLIGKGFCVWDEAYPSMENIEEDLKYENIFVLCNKNNIKQIIGAISINSYNEMDEFKEWKHKNAVEISRVCIAQDKQNLGLSEILVGEIIQIIIKRGIDAIHLSVQIDNIPAYKTYMKLGFINLGIKEMYENKYYLLEKNLCK